MEVEMLKGKYTRLFCSTVSMVHNSVSNALACCLQIHLPCICSSLLVNGCSHQSLWLLLPSEDLHRSHFPQIVTHPSKGFTRTCWDPHLSLRGSAGILNNTDRRDESWCGTTAGKTALGGKRIFMLLKIGISGKLLLCYEHVQLWALRMVQRAKELAAKLEDLGYVSRVHLWEERTTFQKCHPVLTSATHTQI